MKKLFTLITVLCASVSVFAAEDMAKDFDSLGGNTILLDKARALNPEVNTSIVQNRTVNREKRFEIAPEISGSLGGDTYSRTTSIGLNTQFHINHMWSVGAKYNYSYNRLTDEGNSLAQKAIEDHKLRPQNSQSPIPDMDYPMSETGAYLNFYPIYGKMKWFDQGVAHFDVYAQVGGGQVQLKSGSTSTYSAGLGLGIWATRHISTRFEVRYQNYTAQYYTGPLSLDLTVASMQVGWLL